MTLSTPGLVLRTTPYAESSVVARVFTRQLGVQSYMIKGVRSARGRVKQNMLQPLSSLDMVVYANPKTDLNHVRELAPRHPGQMPDPVGNALRFFMTEVLYKALRAEEPMPELWDYVEQTTSDLQPPTSALQPPPSDLQPPTSALPIRFMLTVAHHLGIEPLDNHDAHHPCFDLQEGRFVAAPTETTLSPQLSTALHEYLSSFHSPSLPFTPFHSSVTRRDLLDALIAYFQLHLPGFGQLHSHEILHTILR